MVSSSESTLLVLSLSSAHLSQEKETWQQACYSLSLRVAEQRSLQTIQRLQLSEKSWSKLASHFNILLSDKDTQQASIGFILHNENIIVTFTAL